MIPLNEWSRCDNCQQIFVTDNLGSVEDMDQRVVVGEVTPSGACPKCGAVCHLIRPDVVVEVRGGIVQAIYTDAPMSVFLVDWDNVQAGDQPGEFVPDYFDRMPPETRRYVEQTITDQLKEAGVKA